MDEKSHINLFITDDDPDDREFLKDALARDGYSGKVREFNDGSKLVEHLSAHPKEQPDLILLDLNMPVKDGYDTLKELKTDLQLKTIPVMVLTSSSKAEDERFCYQLGCNYFRRKPTSLHGYADLAHFILSYKAE